MSDETIIVPDGYFLVIGCGSIGKRHLGNLKRLGVNKIIAFDVREDRRREVGEKFGVVFFDKLETAVSQGVRAALICTPTHLHVHHALLAARAGCHIFIEKPISDSLKGIDELLKEVEQRKLHTLVGCNFRFHPGLRHAKLLLGKGAIGTVISARAQFGQYLPDWHPWEDYRETYSAKASMGGGVILDRIHEFDYLYWLLGEITEVYSLSGRLSHLEIDTEDTAEILLRFASGAYGSVHLDYVRRTYDCRLEIIGVEGIIQWCYEDHKIRWYIAEEERWNSLQWPNYDGNEMYVDQMRHLLQVLNGHEVSAVTAKDGKRILTVALDAKQTALDGRPIKYEPGIK